MIESVTYPIRSDRYTMTLAVEEIVHSRKSTFQQIDILRTTAFGKILLLDGHIQLAELDEHAYHEALVHVPLLSVPGASSALVVGGGDGGVLRELARHKNLQRIVMCEIDADVVDACRTHLPELSDGAFEGERVELKIGDARQFLAECRERFDLIVIDATDTYEEEQDELSEALFTASFYQDCRRCLTDEGKIVTQADNLVFCPYSLEAIEATFRQHFARVGSYWALVPSFGGFSGYCWAGLGGGLPPELPTGAARLGLKYLNQDTYRLGLSPHPFQGY